MRIARSTDPPGLSLTPGQVGIIWMIHTPALAAWKLLNKQDGECFCDEARIWPVNDSRHQKKGVKSQRLQVTLATAQIACKYLLAGKTLPIRFSGDPTKTGLSGYACRKGWDYE